MNCELYSITAQLITRTFPL